MKGQQIYYSDAELKWLKDNCTMPICDYHAVFNTAFGRDVSPRNLAALRVRNGWKTGRTGCFVSGQAPHNKGKPYSPPGTEKTRFKKGHIPANARPIGSERIDGDGRIEIKLEGHRKFILKHRYLWEQVHGAVPEGLVLKCLDGNKLNTDPSNWKAIPRAILPRLNGRHGRNYDHAPAELKPTIMVVATLEHKARSSVSDRGSANA